MPISKRLSALLPTILILWSASDVASAQRTLVDSIEVIGYELKSTQRVSRFDFEYQYLARVHNNGDGLSDVTAAIASTNSQVIVLTPEVMIGDFEEGETKDLGFSVRHDRRERFTEEALDFAFEASSPTTGWQTQSLDRLRLKVPPDFQKLEGDNALAFWSSESDPSLPALFILRQYSLPSDFQLTSSTASEDLAEIIFDPSDITDLVLRQDGIFVRTETFHGMHLLVLDEESRRLAVFTTGDDYIFSSERFALLLSTVRFD